MECPLVLIGLPEVRAHQVGLPQGIIDFGSGRKVGRSHRIIGIKSNGFVRIIRIRYDPAVGVQVRRQIDLGGGFSRNRGPGIDPDIAGQIGKLAARQPLVALEHIAFRVDQKPLLVQPECAGPGEIVRLAVRVPDHEKPLPFDGQVQIRCGALDGSLGEYVIHHGEVGPPADLAYPAGTGNHIRDQIRKQAPARLETGRVGVGEVVADHTHGGGKGLKSRYAAVHCSA